MCRRQGKRAQRMSESIMNSFHRSIAAAAFLLIAAPAAQASSGTLTDEDKSVTETPATGKAGPANDASEPATWGVTCDHDVTGRKTGCRVTQVVANPQTGERMLVVTVRRTPDGEPPSMLVTLPLRTFLTPGTLVQIDEQPGWQVPFQLCDENGCYAGLSTNEEMVGALKAGETLKVEFFDQKRRKTVIKLPLKNFDKSFDDAG
jgi:invasion protein IalB